MEEERKSELESKWKKVVTKAVTDEEFKKALVANPLDVMKDFDLILPEEFSKKTNAHNQIKLSVAKELEETMNEEMKWWQWRLNMILEFGKEARKTGVEHVAPQHDDSETDFAVRRE